MKFIHAHWIRLTESSCFTWKMYRAIGFVAVTWRLNRQSGAQIRSRGVHSTNHNGYSMKLRKSSILEWVTVSFIENRTLNMKFSIGAIVRAFASSGWDHHLKGYHDVTVWNQDGVPDGRFRVADLMVSLIDADNRSPAWTHSLMTPTGRLSTFFLLVSGRKQRLFELSGSNQNVFLSLWFGRTQSTFLDLRKVTQTCHRSNVFHRLKVNVTQWRCCTNFCPTPRVLALFQSYDLKRCQYFFGIDLKSWWNVCSCYKLETI